MASLVEVLGPGYTVRLFGKIVDGLTIGTNPAGTDYPTFSAQFARIEGFKVGSHCVRLPIPPILSVSGLGTALPAPECGFDSSYVYWDILSTRETLALQPDSGPLLPLLEEFATRGVSGGLNIDNIRIQGTKVCADIHIWAKIEYLGQKVKFDETFTKCINLGEGCYTVWEIGWANLQLCYRHPYQIVGKLCVGKWGIEKCWERAESIPHIASASEECSCD